MTKNKRHPIKQTARDIWKLSDEGLAFVISYVNTSNINLPAG